MTEIEIYGFIKETLLITLFIQLALSKIKNIKQKDNRVIFLYAIAILLNDIIAIFWSDASSSFDLFHALGPLAIIIGVFFSRLKIHQLVAITTLVGIATLILWINSFAVYISLCFIAIFILLKSSVLMVKWKKLDIYKSSFYIILALDLFASFLELSLGNTPFDWNESVYINYLWYGLISMYLFTLISLNVFFRRLFTT